MLTSRDAEQIAQKLGAEVREGRRHQLAVIRNDNGRLLGSYNIRRASKEVGHDYIPRQIHVTMRQAQNLASCPMSREDYFQVMRQMGHM